MRRFISDQTTLEKKKLRKYDVDFFTSKNKPLPSNVTKLVKYDPMYSLLQVTTSTKDGWRYVNTRTVDIDALGEDAE